MQHFEPLVDAVCLFVCQSVCPICVRLLVLLAKNKGVTTRHKLDRRRQQQQSLYAEAATAEAAQHRQWGNEIEQRVEYTCAWQAHTLLMLSPLSLNPSLYLPLYNPLYIPSIPSFILLYLASSLHPSLYIIYNHL